MSFYNINAKCIQTLIIYIYLFIVLALFETLCHGVLKFKKGEKKDYTTSSLHNTKTKTYNLCLVIPQIPNRAIVDFRGHSCKQHICVSGSISEITVRLACHETGLSPPVKYIYWPFQGGSSFFGSFVLFMYCVFMLSRLFITVLWSPVGKELTSWLSFVVLNCVFVTFPCGILGQVWY